MKVAERRTLVAEAAGMPVAELGTALDSGGLTPETADKFVENVLGTYALPFGIAPNVRVNGKDYIVPMVVEEPSVIAAASNASKMVRAGGGFMAEVDPSIMTCQVQLFDVPDEGAGAADILQPDLCIVGGLLEAKKIAAEAEANCLTIAPHNPLGPVATAVCVHFAASTPNFLILEYVDPGKSGPLREMVVEPMKYKDGYLEIPDTSLAAPTTVWVSIQAPSLQGPLNTIPRYDNSPGSGAFYYGNGTSYTYGNFPGTFLLGGSTFESGAGFGLILGLIAAVASTVAAVLTFRAAPTTAPGVNPSAVVVTLDGAPVSAVVNAGPIFRFTRRPYFSVTGVW